MHAFLTLFVKFCLYVCTCVAKYVHNKLKVEQNWAKNKLG